MNVTSASVVEGRVAAGRIAAGQTAAVERFLIGDVYEIPEPKLLSAFGLAPYAASLLAERGLGGTAADLGVLNMTRVTESARHLAIRTELRRLLRLWCDAGIEVVVFKGFHLAEFVYSNPGLRLYSDVDLLIRPEDARRAALLAAEQGLWEELWHAENPETAHNRRSPGYAGHEILQLRHVDLGVQLDVHARLVHNNHNRSARYGRQEQITSMSWAASQPIDWEGLPIRLLHPLDAVLVGLVLNRAWSPEDWRLRPHDYLDFSLLVEKFALEPSALTQRAEELGCSRTYRLFLKRCNPYRKICRLSPPSTTLLHYWNLLVAPERGNRYLERASIKTGELLTAPLWLARELPGVIEVFIFHRRMGCERAAATIGDRRVSQRQELTAATWRRMRRAVHRCVRLLPAPSESRLELEALALLNALRRSSCPAELQWLADRTGRRRPLLSLDGAPLNVGATLLSE